MTYTSAKKLVFFLLVAHLGIPVLYASENKETPEQLRTLFTQAEQAIKQGDFSDLDVNRERLKEYPLLPYLDYAYLTSRLSSVPHKKIENFIALNSDTPLASRLRFLWLKKLARSGKDDELIAQFKPTTDTALECNYRSALLRKGLTEQALTGIEHLWLAGHSQPDECDSVFNAWKKAGGITPELIWQRIELAMKSREIKLASYLARGLPTQERKQFHLWERVHKQPTLVNATNLFSPSEKLHKKILSYGVQRLAFRDIDNAIVSWNKLQKTYVFSLDEQTSTDRILALLVGQNHHDDASPHLYAFNPALENQRIREWRVRAAIRDRDWPVVLATIGWLTDEEQMTPRWQYWRARALSELGFNEAARLTFNQLVNERSYHGFLAADRLQLPYSFENEPASVSLLQMEIVTALPGIRRAKELLELNRLIEARREWGFVSERLNEDQLLVAAKLAESWQWHSSAIFTAARIAYWDDIPLRFPLGYKNEVVYQANKFDIEPAWVYGIMRQESAFVIDARSGKGALGLMQLLPSTGKYIAQLHKTPYLGSYDLLNADTNIKLGSAYLKDVRNRLFNHPVLATAAYNAGYTRVKRWLPENTAMDADIWIETIPYDETRDYLERVLAYTAIYDWRLNPSHQNSLVHFMKPVAKPDAIATQTNKTTAPVKNSGRGSSS